MSTLTELTGDADVVENKARHYLDIADAISKATASLKKIAEPDSSISDAVDSIKDKTGDVAESISKAEKRYRKTSTALITYAGALRDAQKRAHTAILAAGNVDDNGHAAAQKTHYETLAQTPGPDQAANQKQFDFWTQKVQDQQTDLGSASSDWQTAHDDKESAARTAADAIENSIKDSELNDTWWDNFSAWAGGALDLLKKICEIAAFLSIFLAWVPGLGEVLLALAIVGAVLTVIDTVNKMQHGEAGWGDLALAGVGLVLTVFGGKIFSYVGKFAKMKGIATAMQRGGPIRELTGLGRGNNLRAATAEFRAARPFENPFKMDHDLSWLSQGPKTIAEHVLGVSDTHFVMGFDTSLFASTSMKLAAGGVVFSEYSAIAGRVQTAYNTFTPEDKHIQITVGG
ncbi:hypothetical protein BH09ACT1_BH09ACT1_19790 [soil metagenome]